MKYENEKKKVCVNDYNLAIATLKLLTKEQKEEVDKVSNVATLLEGKRRYIDVSNTLFLNLKQHNSNLPNTVQIPEIDQVKMLVAGRVDTSKYDFIFKNIKPLIDKMLPKRFSNLGIEITSSIDLYEINLSNKKLTPLNKNTSMGNFNPVKRKINFKYPVFIFERKNLTAKNNDILQTSYIQYLMNSFGNLIHEVKHALNNYNLIDVLKDKKVSVFDYLKILKLNEYSAEIEKVFFLVNVMPSAIDYENVKWYIKNNNYYDNIGEFINIVIKDVKEKFLSVHPQTTKENYCVDNAIGDILQNPKSFSKTSDDGVYDELKSQFMSFEVVNPATKEHQIVDLSRYFKDEEISSKERYLLNKTYRAKQEIEREIKRNSDVSNTTLKILEKIQLHND